ncbi:hypothetical protein Pint_14483 [Pistacia integerrima]|uniref:Uncharacterized protein n=1 Tax=Pistacia integerrima TaxID=434235 RepID=A0ACC0Y714_9ROSI|nr:hypothetical protein Pint_14483 [Pistacia integerrima]
MLQGHLNNSFLYSPSLVTLDLSFNQLYGSIAKWIDRLSSLKYLILKNNSFEGKEETIPFTTKNVSYLYEGKVLTYMSGIDLSCNKLTGEIPYQIGFLTRIHTLNLSRNNLTGSIPMTFSHLQQIESLDLSYNNLNGKIPPQLVGLYTLSFFMWHTITYRQDS